MDELDFTSPALYALLLGGAAAFLLLTSAFARGSVTTATAGLVLAETLLPRRSVWSGSATVRARGWPGSPSWASRSRWAVRWRSHGSGRSHRRPPIQRAPIQHPLVQHPPVRRLPVRHRTTGIRSGSAVRGAPGTVRPACPTRRCPRGCRSRRPGRPAARRRPVAGWRKRPRPSSARPCQAAAWHTDRSVPGGSSSTACSPAAIPLDPDARGALRERVDELVAAAPVAQPHRRAHDGRTRRSR